MTYRKKYLSQKDEICAGCNSTENIEVHHIDGDRANDELENLVALCHECHVKVHHVDDLDGVLSQYQDKLPDTTQESTQDTTLKSYTIRLPQDEVEKMEREAEERGFSNRTEYMRRIIKNRSAGGSPGDLNPKTAESLSDEINELRERVEQLESVHEK